MALLDSELAAALKAAKTKPMYFALIAKPNGGKLRVSKAKVSAVDIATAKKDCGGGTVYQGKCHITEHGDDSGATLVFEVSKEPPPTLAAATKKLIRDDAGLIFQAVEFRVNVTAEAEPPQDALHAAPADGAAAPAPPSAAADARAPALADRLKQIAPRLQQALATGHPQAAQAKAAATSAIAAFRNKDYAQSITLLDKAGSFVNDALAAGAKPTVDDSREAQAWQQQVAALEPRYLQAMQANSADANKLRALMAFAKRKAEAGEYPPARSALAQIEPLLVQRQSSPAAPAADFSKEWGAAKSALKLAIDRVAKQLAKFALAILETNEANLVWVAEEGLGQIVTALREIAVAIERVPSTSPAKVAAAAKPLFATMHKQLQSPQVRASDTNKLGVTVTIAATIGQALKQLEDAAALGG